MDLLQSAHDSPIRTYYLVYLGLAVVTIVAAMTGMGPVVAVLVGILAVFAAASVLLAGFLDRNSRFVERCTSYSREQAFRILLLSIVIFPLFPLIGTPLLTVSCMLYMMGRCDAVAIAKSD
jgi:hypothetical protein